MAASIIILGLGGHARVVADTCAASGWTILGFVGPQSDARTLELFGADHLGGDEVLSGTESELANGLGSVGPGAPRIEIYQRLCAAGHRFATLVHPRSIVASSVRIGRGAQIFAGSVIQPGCEIGENAILNTRCSVDHDCVIGAHCHIAPGAVLSGGVELGEDVHVGTGAVIIQGITIGAGAMIAAGAVVTKNVEAGCRVAGVPARSF
ncbi:MAG: acetyltransferase [Chthoniobacterales bacterium]